MREISAYLEIKWYADNSVYGILMEAINTVTGLEIIEVLKGNVGEITTAIGAVTGSLLTAIFLRSNTSIKEFEKIRAGHFDIVVEELLKSGKMTYTEFYKTRNFLSIAKKADQYSSKKVTDEAQAYDFDWFIRFYETVGSISDNEMQEIWARILAGEINNPHSFSLKTIEALKNIGKEEAELFARICRSCFVLGNEPFLPFYNAYMDRKSITYSMIMYLNELGLIYNDGTIVKKISVSHKGEAIIINGDYLLTARTKEETDKELIIKQFPLTVVGKELATLINGMPDYDDFISFVKEIKPDNNIKLEIHKIQCISGNQITFDNEDLLSQS